MLTAAVTSRPTRRPSEQRRGAEQQAGTPTADRGRGQRQHDRQPGRDQHAGEDVPAEVVGAGPVLGRGARQDLAGVDRVGLRRSTGSARRRPAAARAASEQRPRVDARAGSRSTRAATRSSRPCSVLPDRASAGRAARGRRRRRGSRAARTCRTRARWPARPGSPCRGSTPRSCCRGPARRRRSRRARCRRPASSSSRPAERERGGQRVGQRVAAGRPAVRAAAWRGRCGRSRPPAPSPSRPGRCGPGWRRGRWPGRAPAGCTSRGRRGRPPGPSPAARRTRRPARPPRGSPGSCPAPRWSW